MLGLDWLSSLGEVKTNFGKLELTLSRDGKLITLVGDPSLTRTELSYGAFVQILRPLLSHGGSYKVGFIFHKTLTRGLFTKGFIFYFISL